MQNPEHQRSKCPKCGAGRGEPCTRRDGQIAAKVHYGRPHWSAKVGKPKARTPHAETPNAETPRRLAALHEMGLI